MSSVDIDILKCAKVPLTLNLGAAGIPQSIAVRGADFYFENYCTFEDFFNLIRSREDLRAHVTPSDLSIFSQMMVRAKDLGALASCLSLAASCGYSYENMFPGGFGDASSGSSGGGSFAAIMMQTEADAASLANSSISPFNAFPLEGAVLPECLAWVFEKEEGPLTSSPRIIHLDRATETRTAFVSQEYEDLVETREEMLAEFRVTKKLGMKSIQLRDLPGLYKHFSSAAKGAHTSAAGSAPGSIHYACEEKPFNLRLWSRVENGYRNAVLERAEVVVVVGSETMTQYNVSVFRFLTGVHVATSKPSTLPTDFCSSSVPCLDEEFFSRDDFPWDEAAEVTLGLP
jgi:hypothetical protein